MPRNMSFFYTKNQIKYRQKTVTRRLGWNNLKIGEVLNACVKCQGLKKGEKIERLCQIVVIDVRKEKLSDITKEDCIKEGFNTFEPEDFINMFCMHNGCDRDATVTRIEFQYISAG